MHSIKLYFQLSYLSTSKKKGGNNESNLRLHLEVSKAKHANMPHDKIQHAIDQAHKNPEKCEEIMYEAKGAAGVGILVQILTDNRNRAVQQLRHALDKYG
jgi:transcriptional/translational regulatory protein YebC/TACO1